MLSTIKLDSDFVGDLHKPVIRISAQYSEDIRDKMLWGMLQEFGGISQWMKVRWDSNIISENGPTINRVTLTPVHYNMVADEAKQALLDIEKTVVNSEPCAGYQLDLDALDKGEAVITSNASRAIDEEYSPVTDNEAKKIFDMVISLSTPEKLQAIRLLIAQLNHQYRYNLYTLVKNDTK